ncbi:MAG: peptide chain release factor 2 [Clostridia bacterium]|nr:peptide chain release factor 2 [Clostridia bacterium]
MNLEQIKESLIEHQKSLEIIRAVFDIDKLKQDESLFLEKQAQPNFYSDMAEVQKVGKALSSVQKKITILQEIESGISAVEEFLSECADNDVELLQELTDLLNDLAPKIQEMRLTALLRGKYDRLGAILTVQSGAGGTEAQDWAEMLLRMYMRYAEKQGFECTTLDYTEGDGAGIKGATIKIDGENVYGFMKAERGVHRLVRISPFDSNARRHTSFASVEVMPQIENENEVEIKDSDLKIDTFHSGGCGGQGVNTTDSAIRIRHIPTGIVVQCQNERSQIQNKESAMKVLRAKLAQLAEEQFQADMKQVQGSLKKIEWGSQIRSYVFCPYTMVKDHRTDYETANVSAVMDGDIQGFILEYLKRSN